MLLLSHIFRLGGPFEEFANVLIMFVVLQLSRMATGALAVRLFEFISNEPETEEKRKKIATNAFYGIYYLIASAVGVYLLFYATGWADALTLCSREDQNISLSKHLLLHVYHCTQVAFYLNYLFAMIYGIDNRRKDQWAFASHHVITIFLILFSRNWGYMRVQLVLFVLHDAADPLLHIGKLVKALRIPGRERAISIASDVILAVFALVFFATRWFLYPIYLIDSCRIGWYQMYPDDWTWNMTGHRLLLQMQPDSLVIVGYKLSYYGFSMLLLYALFGLHLYWGTFILRMAWKKFNSPSAPSAVEKQQQQFIRHSPRLTEEAALIRAINKLGYTVTRKKTVHT
jgi:TLC domain-containing protein